MRRVLPQVVWLLRHAETTAPHVFNGHESDVDLSVRGEAEAAAVAEWFAPLKPTAVVSSAMRRAVRTAAPVAARCGVPATVEPHLHERKIGVLGGTPFSLSSGPWFDTVEAWTRGEATHTTDGAESFADLVARVVPAWERVLAAHPGGRVVLVAHGIVVKVLLLHLLHAGDPRRWNEVGRIFNVGVSGLWPQPDGSWHADPLLRVPEAVAALSGVSLTPPGVRSEG